MSACTIIITLSKTFPYVINFQVEDQTNHRIKDLISPDSIGLDTRGLLCNALYFKVRNNVKKYCILTIIEIFQYVI